MSERFRPQDVSEGSLRVFKVALKDYGLVVKKTHNCRKNLGMTPELALYLMVNEFIEG